MRTFLKGWVGLWILFVAVTVASAQTPSYITPGGSSNNSFPFNSSSSNKVQWVYTPTEFSPNLQAGLITHVYFSSSNSSSTTKSFSDYRISIGHVNFANFSNGTFITGLTTCYGPTTSSITFNSGGWFGVQLSTPFAYDGTSSLVIEATITNTTGTTVNQNTTNGNKRIWGGRTATSGSTGTGQAACGLEIVTCSTAITQQPVSKTICENEQAVFGITSTDATVFKWQVDEGSGFIDVANSANYTGANTQTLTINNTPATFDAYQYRCLVAKGSSTSCADTSDTVTLNVYGLVKADPMPANDTTCINAIKDMEIKATGAMTGYRWQIYNVITQQYEDITGQAPYQLMGNVLRIAGVSDTLDGSRYRCLVDGICDTLTSTETRLTVLPIPKVGVHPVDVTADQGDKVTFEVQATTSGALYQWQASAGNDSFAFINDGGIYSGVKTNRLTVFGVSRVQDEFRFRCVVRTASSCNAPGDTSTFAVLFVNPAVSVQGINTEVGLSVYPNPTGNVLYIKATTLSRDNDGLKYKIMDKTGKTLVVGNIAGGSENKIDVAHLPADIYLLEILDKSGRDIATSRFTKL